MNFFPDEYTEYAVKYRIEQSNAELNNKVLVRKDEANTKKAIKDAIRVLWGFRQLAVTIITFEKLENGEAT